MMKRKLLTIVAAAIVATSVVPSRAMLAQTSAVATAADSTEVTVMVASLRVREGPSTSAKIVGSLRGGTKVKTEGKSSDSNWWQIMFAGKEAYISAAFATVGGVFKASAAAAPVSAVAAPTSRGRFGPFELGGHIKGTDHLDAIRDIGMSWVKVQIVMDGGAPDARGLIGAIHSKGLKVLIGAIGNRGRAGDGEYHKEFARNVAELAAQGADAIEVWNEPNLDREYGGSGQGQVNPENYANMLREAFGAIKSVNKNTLVVGGAPAPTGYFGGGCANTGCDDKPFAERLARTGAGAWMDCMGAHHNGTMVGPDQTNNAPVGTPWHPQWYFWGTLGTVYNAFGGRVPICWTELGYVTGEGIGSLPGGFSWGDSITLEKQSKWLARAIQLSRESGKVRLMIIWNVDFREWGDDPQAGFSIIRPNGSCPACGAIKGAMGR